MSGKRRSTKKKDKRRRKRDANTLQAKIDEPKPMTVRFVCPLCGGPHARADCRGGD